MLHRKIPIRKSHLE